MLWLDIKYMCLLTNRLKNYKRKSSNLFNFSCVYCDDSLKNDKRSRAYVYEKSGKLKYHCHNCDIHPRFRDFLQFMDEGLYKEWMKEAFQEPGAPRVLSETEVFVQKLKGPTYISDSPLKDLKRVSQLPLNHPCRKYVVARQIPVAIHYKLFFCPKFYEWTNTFIPGKFSEKALVYDGPRLVMPFIDRSDAFNGYQGRSLDPKDEIRYITIMLDENKPRVYGLDSVDFNRQYFCFEGPIDSMFIENSISSAGGDIVSELSKLKCNMDNAVIVYDNEPRNKDTVKKINRAITLGFKVVVWPENLEVKDVNAMILEKLNPVEIIKQNIYSGLTAHLKVSSWNKTTNQSSQTKKSKCTNPVKLFSKQ